MRQLSLALLPPTEETGTSRPSPVGRPIHPHDPRLIDNGRRRQLHERLNALLGGRLAELVLTNNRSTIMTAKWVAEPANLALPPEQRALSLRLQGCFAFAPMPVLVAVARFAQAGHRPRVRERYLEVLRSYSQQYSAPARSRRLVTRGQHHDLVLLRDRLNRDYFNGELDVAITWGRALPSSGCGTGRSRARCSIELGSYSHDDNLIRIHRLLDRSTVPGFVVESVVHHELVHAALPLRVIGGRRQLHGSDFRQLERRYAHLAEAEAWLDRHLAELLRQR